MLVPARDLSTASFGVEEKNDRVMIDSGRGTGEHAAGSSSTGIQPTQYQGREALVFTRRSERGGVTFVDATLLLRDGLIPVWEVARNSRGWRARFDYDGAKVRVDAAWPDSTRQVTHTYPHPVFNFNELDAIVRALPLRDGYHTIVALYSEGDDTIEMDTISVSAPRSR